MYLSFSPFILLHLLPGQRNLYPPLLCAHCASPAFIMPLSQRLDLTSRLNNNALTFFSRQTPHSEHGNESARATGVSLAEDVGNDTISTVNQGQSTNEGATSIAELSQSHQTKASDHGEREHLVTTCSQCRGIPAALSFDSMMSGNTCPVSRQLLSRSFIE